MDHHSHSAQDVGAAPEGHHHSAYDIGAAEDNHTHYPREVGASPESHEHLLSQVAGAASEQDLKDLASQTGQLWLRLTSVEDSIRNLLRETSRMSAELEAERRANATLRSGVVTIRGLARALRIQAETVQEYYTAQALFDLASTIEREAS
jgi:hypothetical protein